MKGIHIDVQVVARATEGDAAALRQIVEALYRPSYNLALRMLLSPADAEDATQEALLKIVTRISSFAGQAKFTTWSWTVIARTCLDFRKGKFRHPMMSVEQFQADLADGWDREAEQRMEDRVLLAQVKLGCTRALLQCLDGEHRLAFILGEIGELSGAEAAAISGVNETTFRQRLRRARQRLYGALQKHCELVQPTAGCSCHGRLRRALELGRVSRDQPGPELDLAQLRPMLHQLEHLHARGAAYFRADPEQEPPASLIERLRL